MGGRGHQEMQEGPRGRPWASKRGRTEGPFTTKGGERGVPAQPDLMRHLASTYVSGFRVPQRDKGENRHPTPLLEGQREVKREPFAKPDCQTDCQSQDEGDPPHRPPPPAVSPLEGPAGFPKDEMPRI